MKDGYLYYASDKAVYDALLQYNFKKSDMKELFLSRGIIISPDTERDAAALYFSRLNHDYYDHQKIASIFGAGVRKERVSVTHISNVFSDAKLDAVAQELKEKMEASGSEVRFAWVGKKLEIEIKYEEYNSNKSEFKQSVEKHAVVELEMRKDGVVVRYPQNKFVECAKADLIDLLAKNNGDAELSVSEIQMRTLVDTELRTQFFRNLLQGLSGYKLKDVTDVYVYNPKVKGAMSDGEDIGIHITKASLKGEGLLSSPELNGLLRTGFFVCKVVWTTVAAGGESDVIELEAQFSDPEHCEKFSYAVKGRYKKNDQGHHNKSRIACEPSVERKMLKLIESSAVAALEVVRNKFAGSEDDEDQ